MYYFKYTDSTNSKIKYNNSTIDNYDLVSARYPVKLTDYYASLITSPDNPIGRQCLPHIRELEDEVQCPDPLTESSLSPVPGLIHRYPDRVVLLVSNRCPVYCRFCMRKRHVGNGDAPMAREALNRALQYINDHPAINDVILSGGDPLMLADESLTAVLDGIRAIPHVSVIRIGTRVPVTFPERITGELANLLKRYHPLYINTHFNHPDEITPASRFACGVLADAGIPLGNQTVLLKGVNDSVETMKRLMTGLLSLRVKPYYLHQMDLVKGTAHFRTSVTTGLKIIAGMRGHISGLAVPQYVIDLPGGKGKVALLPDDVEFNDTTLSIRTYTGERVSYEDIRETRE